MNARYQIIGPIAEGGRGEVLRGWDSHLGREVAVKKVRKTAEEDGGARDGLNELVKEARTLSTLQHPNVVTVYDVGVDDEGAFIVMELVKGETLEDIVARGALTERDFDTLVNQTLEGMIAAHAAGLIHLDLKPQNLMITWLPSGSFQVKILDFGLAMSAVQPVLQETDSEGGILGSIFFMAPEQFERGVVGSRTDLYSLGCIFYYALTGQYPFQGEMAPQVMAAHLYHRLTPLEKLRPDLPAYIPAWVDWLQSRLPEDRPASTAAALKAYREKRVPKPAVAVALADDTESPAAEAGKLKRDLMPKGLLGEQGRVAVKGGGRSGAAATPVHPRSARPVHTVSRLSRYTIPVLALLVVIAGSWFWLTKRKLAKRAQRFVELAQQEGAPEASAQDVRLLLSYAEDPQTSPAACLTLGRLRGGAEVDGAILRAAKAAKTQSGKINLLNVVIMREINGGLDLAWERMEDSDVKVQEAAWRVVAGLATPPSLPNLLERCETLPEPLEKYAEAALVSIVQRAENPETAAGPILNAYQSGLGAERYRALLVRVLGQIGGQSALAQLQRAMENASAEVRRAAISALSGWPSSEPLPLLAEKFDAETDPAARILILRAAGQLAPQPGALPQEALFEQAKRLYEAAKDNREKDQALGVLSRVEAAECVAYLEALAAQDPARAANIEAIVLKLLERVGQIVTLADGKVVLEAAQADFNRGTSLMLVNGTLVNWDSSADWASWLVKLPAGRHTVQVSQANESSEAGSYEVLLAGSKLTAQSTPTGAKDEYKDFEVGKVEVAQPGTYRLTLRVRDLPGGQSLFRLKAVTLKTE